MTSTMTPTWDLPHTHRTPQGDVRWAAFGDGPPVVLLHGTPFSSLIWSDVGRALARTHRVYVWDMPGFGRSEQRAGQDVSLATQAGIFAGLLEHWGLAAPDVVAHDVGGTVALRATLLHGATYRHLALVDAVSVGDWGTGFFTVLRDAPETFGRLPASAHEALVASHTRSASHRGLSEATLDALLAPWRGPQGQAAYYRQYAQALQSSTDEIQDLLADLTVPVTILWGREDTWLPPHLAELLQSRIPHATLTWLEDAGHLSPLDAPAQLLAHLLPQLA
ncbi:alpha/beta fold hydrolase [Oerskovia flava]|uniref:alpha/beta fold hydrolase n=1 Tax=Oerskovia flava TaxID=2986422 RepID=UPI00223F4F24|nr:alpha/beta hydrolase [Oerskovia sp. JB1-3-2]